MANCDLVKDIAIRIHVQLAFIFTPLAVLPDCFLFFFFFFFSSSTEIFACIYANFIQYISTYLSIDPVPMFLKVDALQKELQKTKAALDISNGKLRLKDELASAAMAAQAAAEKSLQLADRRN